MLTTSLWYYK